MIGTDLETMTRLMHSKEPLHPELQARLRTDINFPMVSHPLYVGFSEPAGLVNAQFEACKQAVAAALDAREWQRYIGLHARPYRLDALVDAIDGGLDDKPALYWEMVSWVWTDSENNYQSLHEWIEIWNSGVPDRHLVMNDDDRATLEALPEVLKVWRGVSCDEAIEGLSWTLDRDKAVWFAQRYSGSPQLVEGRVQKADVCAYFSNRSEAEIVSADVQVIDCNVVPARVLRK